MLVMQQLFKICSTASWKFKNLNHIVRKFKITKNINFNKVKR